MASFIKKIVVFILFLALSLPVDGSKKIKREYADLYPLSDVTNEFADQDLETGLHSLSSAELKTLSNFIDEENKNAESNDLLSSLESYWHGDQSSETGKKKRTIDDLYDELAHENAGIKIKSESYSNPSKVQTNDGKCRCEKPDEKDETVRTKRDSLKVDVGEEPNMEDYVRELEDSFPRVQMSEVKDGNNMEKNEHIRIKRL